MANDRNVSYKISTDTKQAETSLSNLEKSAKKSDQGINGLSLAFKKASIAVAAVSGTVLGLVAAYRTQEQAEIKLQNTLRSTGFAAGLSANELTKLASELQNVTTVGDETIIAAQSILLRFTSIGKEVFPRATEAVLDLAQGMGTGLNEAAKKLGKVLEDPTRGLEALAEAGIVFTGEQKKAINEAVRLGDTLTAQNIVLGNVERSYGGLARSATDGTGAIIQLKNILGDIAESGGKILLPFVLKLNEQLTITAKFWNEVASSLATPNAEQLKKDIADTEAQLNSLEGAYKQAKLSQDNLDRQEGFQGTRQAIEQAEQDIINYGFSSGNTTKQILGQWADLNSKLADLRTQLKDAENKDFAGSAEALALSKQQQLDTEKSFNDSLKALREEYRISETEEFATELETTNNQLAQIEFAEQESNLRRLAKEQGQSAALEQIQKQRLLLVKKNLDETTKQQEAASKASLELQNKTEDAKLDILTNAGKLAGAALSKDSKAAFAIQQAAAIASAFVATQRGAALALPNLFLAGLIKTAGALNIAAIAATTIKGFAEGGLVEGPTSFGRVDNIPARLQAGELVAPRQNFDEVVEAVARARGFTRDDGATNNTMTEVRIGFTDNAFEIIEEKLFERRALGV
jgi:hypothetical protein